MTLTTLKNEHFWEQATEKLRQMPTFQPDWRVGNYYNALRIHLSGQGVTFKELQEVSAICETDKIDLEHFPASGSEYTPSGDYVEIIVWKDK
jgi:hypothetical protein